MKPVEITAPAEVTVRVSKYDGQEYRRWNARLARHEGSLIMLDAQFEYEVQHHLLGQIQRGTRTIEYYWLDRWYNVFRFLQSDGRTRLYYCNVSTPPSFDGGVLSYVDLDIDVLVQADFSFEVLDLDEFEKNAELFGYDNETKQRAHAAVEELSSMIEKGRFPFCAL
jgi:protein associated with RNAse G/E